MNWVMSVGLLMMTLSVMLLLGVPILFAVLKSIKEMYSDWRGYRPEYKFMSCLVMFGVLGLFILIIGSALKGAI